MDQMLNQDRINARLEMQANYHKNAKDEHSQLLRNQVTQDQKNKNAIRMAERMNDMSEAEKQRNYNSMMNMQEASMKKNNMASYKDQLDAQMAQRKAYQMYGNMSQQEKAMNKDDLHAYKRFDNNQYAMIPGFNSQKALVMPRDKKASPGNSSSKEAKLQTSVDRLAGYGFSHLGGSGSEKVLPNIPTRPDMMASINKNY